MRIREYLFGPFRDRSGTVLLLSRFDMALAVLLAFTLMAAFAFSSEVHGWTSRRIIVVSGIVLISIVFSQRPKVIFGASFAVITLRIALAAVLGFRSLTMLGVAAACAGISWLLLRGSS